MSILNKTVSYFPGITATTHGAEMNLLQLLQSQKHKETIICLRESDADQQKRLKEKLPCYTASGVFSRRCDEGLIQPSGLAAVDLDSAEDYDPIYLMNELKKIDCIAYAGLSCRGKRLFCIVPFKYPDLYVKQYERLVKSFIDWGLPMGDDCHKRISQPRFVSWNDETTQFFNHNARSYHLLPPEKKYYPVKRTYKHSEIESVPANTFQWCAEQINKSHSFIEGARHRYLVALARYCNLKGLDEHETLCGCLSYKSEEFSESEIKNIIKHIYAKQIGSHNKFPFIKRKYPSLTEGISLIAKVDDALPNLMQVTEINYSECSSLENWNKEIAELKEYYETISLPGHPVKLNQFSVITNVSLFVENHFATLKANEGNRTFLPYLNRLQELKECLIASSNEK